MVSDSNTSPVCRILVTGGCGFIAHHFVDHVYVNTNWEIVVIDKLSYASMGFARLRDVFGDPVPNRIRIFSWDLASPLSEGLLLEIGKLDYIVHMAADSHVDNSIADPVPFMKNNIDSTIHILELARSMQSLKFFFYFSTDEVFGPADGDTLYKEWDRHRPTNPYSASKSAGEQICIAYSNTYSTPVMIVNVMNAIGERQHVEKFLPLCIKKVIRDEKVLIHSYPGGQKSGTRFYIHARNIAAAVFFLMQNGNIGEKYNIAGEEEISNLELAQIVGKTVGKVLKYEMVDFHSTRPGHDLRYGLDESKLRAMGFTYPVPLRESIERTIKWTMEHPKWLE